MPATSRAPKSLGFFPFTPTAAAIPLPSIPAGTACVVIVCETTGFRWRDDGTDPTGTVGNLVAAGATLNYVAGNFPTFRAIGVGGAAAACDGNYYDGPLQ